MTVTEEGYHLNGKNRFITDNRKAREKYKQRQNCTKETVIAIKSNNVLTDDKKQGNEKVICYAGLEKDNKMNISNNVVNLPEIYKQLLEGESKNTSKVEISSPNVCTN